MATMNSGPGAILAPAAGLGDSYAVGFMRQAPKALTSSRIHVQVSVGANCSRDYTIAAGP